MGFRDCYRNRKSKGLYISVFETESVRKPITFDSYLRDMGPLGNLWRSWEIWNIFGSQKKNIYEDTKIWYDA